MHKTKKYPSNVLSQVTISGHRYFPISDGPTYRYHDRLPYCQNAFSQASRQRCLEIYTKPVVRKNQESLFETFSKRSPPPSKNLSSLQKYIPNGSYLRYFYQTKQKQKFLSILAIFPGFYGGREYLRPKYRGQRQNEVEDFSCIGH